MTALKEYERLEASGLWHADAEAQGKEVVVSIGEATLTISNFNNQALTHWSLAAISRQNPGQRPAVFHPDGDPGETLELPENEGEMIDAIERLRRAVDRARPHPGRLRFLSLALILAAFTLLAVFWLPGAMRRHAIRVVPDIQRQDIGDALLASVERVAGKKCDSADGRPVLATLARRTGVARIVVLPGGLRDSAHLPGGIVMLNKAVIEDLEDPAAAAGFVLAERLRAARHDPLSRLLADGGLAASFRLLTRGEISRKSLETHAENILISPPAPLSEAVLLQAFATARISTRPYAYARDMTGESTIGLIEADPMAEEPPMPVLSDRNWLLLQNICGG